MQTSMPIGPFTCAVHFRSVRPAKFIREDRDGITYLVARDYELFYETILRFDDGAELGRLADLSLRHRLPTMCGDEGCATAGGLMTYSVSRDDTVRQVAGYVDRLLRGANPAELSAEQPTKFELVINLKTAKALGVTIPSSLLLQADRGN